MSINSYIRPSRIEIRLGALAHNFNTVRSLLKANTKIMAVVKANAYGHGLLRTAQEFIKYGADYLGVAFLEEGLVLRQAGITKPILVLGAISTEQIPQFLHADLEITLPSLEKAQHIDKQAALLGMKAKVHIKIDTGMERIGVHSYNVENFFNEVLQLKNLNIIGIYSHLATADSDLNFAHKQVTQFKTALELYKKFAPLPPLCHLLNSAGIVNLPEAQFDMVRPGIMLYGYEPSPFKKIGLEPVLRLASRVAYFKVVASDTGISYGHTYTTKNKTRIVTIPIGYGDGYRRGLSNKAPVIINGKRYTIAGRVCMDQCMVDIGEDGTAYNGDEVLLLGKRGEHCVTMEEICTILDTIPYEVCTGLNERLARIYVED